MSEVSNSKSEEEEDKPSKRKEKQEFKKPSELLVLNKKPKKSSHGEHRSKHHGASPAEHISHHSIPLPYKEPDWSAVSEGDYNFDVLKSGKIIDNLVVKSKAFYTFGRQGNCDFPMLNPTISRYHAIFQFRKDPSNDQSGFYLYDLGSTHGTFLNKKKIPPNTYIRMRVGHMLKLGLSTRYFILNGPDDDMDMEYDNIRRLREELEDEDEMENNTEMKESKKKDEGIDWGMGDDADEETDLSENPYAATNNEDLYLNDPKKTLRNWFEREGYELEFTVEEKGPGHFACSIELPIDVNGIKKAQTIVKGKKNHAKVQCALEACKLLDRYGLLKVANHASLKAKPKKWEDDDFYDSDEDSFLDRTGTIEKKRHQRMKAAGKLEPKVETYSSLVEKNKNLVEEIEKLENELAALTHSKTESQEEEKDELDAFMDDLHYSVADKTTIKKINDRLVELKKDQKMCEHMMTLSKPVELPSLNPNEKSLNKDSSKTKSKTPLFGPRKNLHRKKKEHRSNKEAKTEKIVINEDDESENDKDSLDNLNQTEGDKNEKIKDDKKNKNSSQKENKKKEMEQVEEEIEEKKKEIKKKEVEVEEKDIKETEEEIKEESEDDEKGIEEKKKDISSEDEEKREISSQEEEKKEISEDEEEKKEISEDEEEKKEISEDEEEKKEISEDEEEKKEVSSQEDEKKDISEDEEMKEVSSQDEEKKDISEDEEMKEISEEDEEKKKISKEDEEKKESSEDLEKKESSEEEDEIMKTESPLKEIKSDNDVQSTLDTKIDKEDDSLSINSDQNESSDKEMTNNDDDIETNTAVPIKSKGKKRKSSSSNKEKTKISKYEDPPEYTGWLPPNDQTGDGKTSLNDKYGY